jgi:UDP-glucose 4-epimerase
MPDHAQGAQGFDERNLTEIEDGKLLVAFDERRPFALLLVGIARNEHPQVLDGGSREAVVEIDEHRAPGIPQQVAEMAVAVQPELAPVAAAFESPLDGVDRLARHLPILLRHRRLQQARGQKLGHRRAAEPPMVEPRAMLESARTCHGMNAPERAPEHLARARHIELGRPAAPRLEKREAEAAVTMQGTAFELQRGRDGDLRGRELQPERMFLDDLGVAPAPRAVELDHHGVCGATVVDHGERRREAYTVDPVLVTVERKEAGVDLEAEGFDRIEDGLRRESGKGQTGGSRCQCGQTDIPFTAAGPELVKIGGSYGLILAGSAPYPMKTRQKSTILVTGGAGYIGSHTVLRLRERGDDVVVLDNLSTGFRQAIAGTTLVEGDVGDASLVSRLFEQHNIDTVVHFAAHTIVPESVSDPLKYYGNNTCQTRSLLASCQRHGVKNFVFSSTAAVYGIPADGLADDRTSALAPINPYGTSKLMSEMMLRDLAAASPLRHVVLRYFNVAGSDPQGRIGQSTRKATLLIKVACEASVGKRPAVSIYGTDYATPDGTGVRDYIHVDDLARAHLNAVDYLHDGGASTTLNCGYGHGYSVREVLDSVRRVSGKPLVINEEPRRAGDPPMLIAQADRIRSVLGWEPRLDDLDEIVRNALRWEEKLLREPW